MSNSEQGREQDMDTSTISVGDRVSYEDMANPRRRGMIVATGDAFGQYTIAWDDDTTSTSDCRQAGWRLEQSGIGDVIRAAKWRQARELDAVEAALPALVAIQGRYRGTRHANKVSTQARRAAEAIETLLSLTQNVER
jgi:hypothetical protein